MNSCEQTTRLETSEGKRSILQKEGGGTKKKEEKKKKRKEKERKRKRKRKKKRKRKRKEKGKTENSPSPSFLLRENVFVINFCPLQHEPWWREQWRKQQSPWRRWRRRRRKSPRQRQRSLCSCDNCRVLCALRGHPLSLGQNLRE